MPRVEHDIPESLIVALGEVKAFCEEYDLQYAVIGGLAAAVWGEPRATKDVDCTVISRPEDDQAIAKAFYTHFKPRTSESVERTSKSRVATGLASNGAMVDMSLAIAGFHEEAAMGRVVFETFKGGIEVPVLGREDFVVFKCLAGRPQDLLDLQKVIDRAGKDLDDKLVRKILRQFEELVYPVDPVGIFDDLLAKSVHRIPDPGDDLD